MLNEGRWLCTTHMCSSTHEIALSQIQREHKVITAERLSQSSWEGTHLHRAEWDEKDKEFTSTSQPPKGASTKTFLRSLNDIELQQYDWQVAGFVAKHSSLTLASCTHI